MLLVYEVVGIADSSSISIKVTPTMVPNSSCKHTSWFIMRSLIYVQTVDTITTLSSIAVSLTGIVVFTAVIVIILVFIYFNREYFHCCYRTSSSG